MTKYAILVLVLMLYLHLGAQNRLVVLEHFDSIKVSQKTRDDVEKAYDIIAKAPIFFKDCTEIANNCENRSAFANHVLKETGFEPVNFWIFKQGYFTGYEDVGGLEYHPQNGQCHTNLFWRYHVTPGVVITSNGIADTLVFDPWTQNRLVTMHQWASSFFGTNGNQVIFIFPVKENYFFFPTDGGKLKTDADSWKDFKDDSSLQMCCGLVGITPNDKCKKKRFQNRIETKKKELNDYLNTRGVSPIP